MYILYTFFLAVAYWLSGKRYRHHSFLSGLFIGLAASLRPTVIAMAIPMLIYKKWKLLFGSLAGLLSAITISILSTGPWLWMEYFSAMRTWSQIHLGLIKTNSSPAGFSLKNIEGMDNLLRSAVIPATDSSITMFFPRFDIKLSVYLLIIFFVLILLFICIILYRYWLRDITSNLLFLVGIELVFLSEFFLPASRASYADIIWILPLSLIIIEASSIRDLLVDPLVILLFSGLFFSTSFSWLPGGILISDGAILAYTILTMLIFVRKNWQTENGFLGLKR